MKRMFSIAGEQLWWSAEARVARQRRCSVGELERCNGAPAFTLIELLVVISIIGLLAGFILGGAGSVVRSRNISKATAEMAQLEAAIARYKADYGVYPPSGTNALMNPLYFELQGVTNINIGSVPTYVTLDGMNSIPASQVPVVFQVGGLVNCSHGTGEDAAYAKNYLPNVKATQIATNGNGYAFLVTSAGGPDAAYKPLGASGVNPWRYNSVNPTNNPTSYDLYVQLVVGGKTNLVCNWSKQVIKNSPLP